MLFFFKGARVALGGPISLVICTSLVVCFRAGPVQADQDTELRLNQGLELSTEQREQELLEEERAKDQSLPSLIVDRQEYEVRRNRDDLGRALYVALRDRNWSAAERFLNAYLELDNPDPMLVHYAQGKLARLRGNMDQAKQEFKALLALQPDFLPGRLELARVLFENHENREAERRFRAIKGELDPAQPHTEAVRRSVDTFVRALEERHSWHGRIAVGPSYSDNVNLSSESETCLIAYSNGFCFISRSVPAAVEAGGLDFEAALEKDFFLPGHGSLVVQALAYGDRYRDHSVYNQSTYIASAGYQYRNARNTYTVGPVYEYADYGNDSLYHAWGGFGEWMHYWSPRTAFKLEGDHKQMRYRRDVYSRFDGGMTSLNATLWHQLVARWTVFGGLDGVDRNTEESFSSYEQYGVRLGMAAPLWGWGDMTLFASLRQKRYDTHNPVLEVRREDIEQNYTAILRFTQLALAGVVPSLTLEHARVRSDVGWLYSYEQNEASLKFEWRF